MAFRGHPKGHRQSRRNQNLVPCCSSPPAMVGDRAQIERCWIGRRGEGAGGARREHQLSHQEGGTERQGRTLQSLGRDFAEASEKAIACKPVGRSTMVVVGRLRGAFAPALVIVAMAQTNSAPARTTTAARRASLRAGWRARTAGARASFSARPTQAANTHASGGSNS